MDVYYTLNIIRAIRKINVTMYMMSLTESDTFAYHSKFCTYSEW